MNPPRLEKLLPKTMSPAISVVVPAFNAERHIKSMIESILRQTWHDFELVICDDGSTDDTERIIRTCKDHRIKLLSLPKNYGVGVARQAAIDAARGEWIALLDSDDAMHPSRLERLLECAGTEKNILIFDNIAMFRENNGRLMYEGTLRPPRQFGCPNSAFKDITISEYIRAERLLIKPIINREALLSSGIQHTCRIFGEDSEFFINLGLNGFQFRYLSSALYHYRITPGSATRAASGNYHLMRECIAEIAAPPNGSQEIANAFAKKLSQLASYETIYSVQAALKKQKFSSAAHLLSNRPKAIIYLFSIIYRKFLNFLRIKIKIIGFNPPRFGE